MTSPSPYITILGGGPAGLAVGYFARKKNLSFKLYEAGGRTGGNAITLSHNGFRFDSGAHRFHDKDPEVTGEVKQLLGDDLARITAPSQIFTRGVFIDFPLTPFNLFLKLGPFAFSKASLELLLARLESSDENISFEDFALRTYGKTIAQRFLLSYSEKLWGKPCSELSLNISGRRLKGLDLSTLMKEIFLGKRAKVDHLEGDFYYPRMGYGSIVDALAEECGTANLRCGARITRLRHRDGAIRAIEINGKEEIPVEEVLSTLPLPVLLNILDPPPQKSVLDKARDLTFRNLILVVVMLDRERVTGNASIYIPDPEIPFTRIYEPKNRSAAMAPEGMTSLCVEFPCAPGDDRWTLSDAELLKIVQENLQELGLIQDGELTDFVVHRMSHAYPVLELGFGSRVAELHETLEQFSNLKVVGRNGKFLYTHLHDMLRFGMDVIAEYTR